MVDAFRQVRAGSPAALDPAEDLDPFGYPFSEARDLETLLGSPLELFFGHPCWQVRFPFHGSPG